MDFLLKIARDVEDTKRDIAALRAAMRYRRAVGSVLMERDLISAIGGTLVIGKSAASVYIPMTVPAVGTWILVVQNPLSGGFYFDNGDVCRVVSRVIDGDDFDAKETWFTVSGRAPGEDGTQTYTCTYNSGNRGYTYPSGAPVVGYGQNGAGYLALTSDGTNAPRYSIYTHTGTPWSAETERGRWGNMNGAFGVSANVMGFGVGDYDEGNYLKYDSAGGLVLTSASGNLTVDANGLRLRAGSAGDPSPPYRFGFTDGANETAHIYAVKNHLLGNRLRIGANAFPNTPTRIDMIAMSESGPNTGSVVCLLASSGFAEAFLQISATESGGYTEINSPISVRGITSLAAQGTAPISAQSTTLCPNLNAELWGGMRVITRDSVTLQPTLQENDYIYTNTQISIPPQPDTNYEVWVSPRGAPCMWWTSDETTTGFVLWAAIDTRLTSQSVTPTLRYVVVR